MNKPKVFISYASDDIDFAKWLFEALKKSGIEPLMDQIGIRFGDNFVSWINEKVGESDYMLTLLSPNSLNRYWVETEWSSALAKEAHLKRTFLIPSVLPGLEDDQIPSILKSKLYCDFRIDQEKAIYSLISRLKDDELIKKELGSFPVPATNAMVKIVDNSFDLKDSELIEVYIYSNRFSRCFKLSIPHHCTPKFILNMIRNSLSLKYNNLDNDLLVELSYTYYLKHNNRSLTLSKTLLESGVKDGDRLELWIRVTLRDLLENISNSDSDLSKEFHFKLSIGFELDKIELQKLIREGSKRRFTSVMISEVASKFFKHVDD